MIDFRIRFDEALGKWQMESRAGSWSKPVRMPKLVQMLQQELTSFEEQEKKVVQPSPATRPSTYNRSPVRELEDQIAWAIRDGKVQKLPAGRTTPKPAPVSSDLANLLTLLELN